MRNTCRMAASLLFVAWMAAMSTSPATAADPALGGVIVVEFQDIPRNPGVKYHLKWVIEIEGNEKQFKATVQTDANQTGMTLCENLYAAVKNDRDRGWAVEKDGKKLSIIGWTDPKTGKFYPVKKAIVTSDDLPKELMPKVTDTRKKA